MVKAREKKNEGEHRFMVEIKRWEVGGKMRDVEERWDMEIKRRGYD